MPTLLWVPSFFILGCANSSFMPVLALMGPSLEGKSFWSLQAPTVLSYDSVNATLQILNSTISNEGLNALVILRLLPLPELLTGNLQAVGS